jgi:hypothetical protein
VEKRVPYVLTLSGLLLYRTRFEVFPSNLLNEDEQKKNYAVSPRCLRNTFKKHIIRSSKKVARAVPLTFRVLRFLTRLFENGVYTNRGYYRE